MDNMKIIVIGDTHGREIWKQIVSSNTFDKIVFIGDYFDTHENVSSAQQIHNFKEIIEYKRQNIDKVVLLFGNHDFHYLRNIDEQYSGFQEWHKFDIQEQLHNALDSNLMQMCFVHESYLCSHAGISKTWLKSTGYTGEEPIELFINDLFKYQPLAFKFTVGKNFDMYGDDITQTPIWIRPKSLFMDMIGNYIQIVGHTTQERIKQIDNKLVLIDTLGTSKQFILIENENLNIIQI
jgi:hypothetical protein